MEEENTQEKIYKTRQCTRNAISKYHKELKEKNPEQYRRRREICNRSYMKHKQKIHEALNRLSLYENNLVISEVH